MLGRECVDALRRVGDGRGPLMHVLHRRAGWMRESGLLEECVVLFRTFWLWLLWLRNHLFERALRILELLPFHLVVTGMLAGILLINVFKVKVTEDLQR